MSEEIVEAYGFLTDVITSGDETEQRAQLREVPLRSQEFSVLLDERDAQLANALIYGAQAKLYGVPLWQYGSRLTTQFTSGSATLTTPTTDIPYAVDQCVLLLASPYSWEAFEIDAVGAGTLTTAATAGATWPVGTLVCPMEAGRLSQDQPFDWLDLKLGRCRARFELEAVAA